MKSLAGVEYSGVFGAPDMKEENEKIWEDLKVKTLPKDVRSWVVRSSSTRRDSLLLI